VKELADEELVARYRLAGGSPRGAGFLNELFRRHYRRVGLWCLRMSGDRDAAADLAQEIFLKACQSLETFRGESRFTTWLYVITRNHCLNALAAKSSLREDPIEPQLFDLADPRVGDPGDRLESRERHEVFRRLMRESLTSRESLAMTLHYAEEMPLDAVTRVMGLDNPSGAKALVVSAKRKLAAAAARWRAATGSKPRDPSRR
jgi:RNA polymerase sigma-70 factor (ECF subfamily)